MWCSIRGRGVPAFTGEIPVPEYTVTCAAAREYGSATVEIPWDHPALASLPETGDSTVTLTIHHGMLGGASYVLVDEPEALSWGMRATWSDPLVKMEDEPVTGRDVFVQVPAGEIFRRAVLRVIDSTAGMPFTLGTITRGALIPYYEFDDRRSLAATAADLAEQSGEEWFRNAEGQLCWQPATGATWPNLLVNGWDCHSGPEDRHPDRERPVGRVVLIDQYEATTVAQASEHYGNLSARTLPIERDVQSAAEARQIVLDTLARLSVRRVNYDLDLLAPFTVVVEGTEGSPGVEGILGDGIFEESILGDSPGTPGSPPVIGSDIAHWAIPPGDFVRVLFTAGRTTEMRLLRVMQRTFGDRFSIPRLATQAIPFFTATTIHATRFGVGPQAPPKTLAKVIAETDGANRQSPFFLMASNIGSVPTSRLNEPVPDALLKDISIDKVIGDFPPPDIADDSITDAKIDSVSAVKVTGTLATAQFADGAVTDAKIADVDQAKINWTLGTVAPAGTDKRYITVTDDGVNFWRIEATDATA